MSKHKTVVIKMTSCQRERLRIALTRAFETKISIDPGCTPQEWLGVMDAVFHTEEETGVSGSVRDG